MHYQPYEWHWRWYFKVICGHGESASWRLRLCGDGSHWLDTFSFSNSSSRNWNSWFVAMIVSLNIVAKTFAKIAKTFAGLSVMIMATRRRHVLILHLEAKYAKNGLQKWNLREKLGKEHLDRKKSTLVKSQRSILQKSKSTLKESTAWGQSHAGDDVSDDASWWH